VARAELTDRQRGQISKEVDFGNFSRERLDRLKTKTVFSRKRSITTFRGTNFNWESSIAVAVNPCGRPVNIGWQPQGVS